MGKCVLQAEKIVISLFRSCTGSSSELYQSHLGTKPKPALNETQKGDLTIPLPTSGLGGAWKVTPHI